MLLRDSSGGNYATFLVLLVVVGHCLYPYTSPEILLCYRNTVSTRPLLTPVTDPFVTYILLLIPSFLFECGLLLALFAGTYIHTYIHACVIHTYNIILFVYWNFSVIYINHSSVNLRSNDEDDDDDDSNNNVL